MSFRIQQRALNDRDNRVEDDATNHRAIYEAIALGDGQAAEGAMLKVIMHGKESLIEALSRLDRSAA